jgi:threonine synthase
VTDDEIREAIKLYAETEGIFAESAGGVTLGVAKKLIATGKIPREDSAVLCIAGNGLMTLGTVDSYVGKPREIKPNLREFETLSANEQKVKA